MKVLIKTQPWRGEYDLEVGDFSTREWGWIKRLTGYLPLTVHEGFGDPELLCVFAAIALRRAGRIDNTEVVATFERLIDDPAFETIDIEQEPHEDADAGPPPPNSSSNTATSGTGSPRSSETPANNRSPTGTPASATSAFDLPTLVT